MIPAIRAAAAGIAIGLRTGGSRPRISSLAVLPLVARLTRAAVLEVAVQDFVFPQVGGVSVSIGYTRIKADDVLVVRK